MKKLIGGILSALMLTSAAFAATTPISWQSLADSYSHLVKAPAYTVIGNRGNGTITWNQGINTANIRYDVVTDTTNGNRKIDVILRSRGDVNDTYTTMQGAATFIVAGGKSYVMLKSWSMNPAIVDNTTSSWNDFVGKRIPLDGTAWHDPSHESTMIMSGTDCTPASTGSWIVTTGSSSNTGSFDASGNTVTGSITTTWVWSGNVNSGTNCSTPTTALPHNHLSGNRNASGMLHNRNRTIRPGHGAAENNKWMGGILHHLVKALQNQSVATGNDSIHLLGTLNNNRSVMTFDTNGIAGGSLIIASKPHGIGISAFGKMDNTLDLSYYVLPSQQSIFRMQTHNRLDHSLIRMNLRGKFYNAAGTSISAPTNIWSLNGIQ